MDINLSRHVKNEYGRAKILGLVHAVGKGLPWI